MTTSGAAKGDPSGISGIAASTPPIPTVEQESAATAFFFLFADTLAGSIGRVLVSRMGMHERDLQHLDHLLAVVVRGARPTAAISACRHLVARPCHPGASSRTRSTKAQRGCSPDNHPQPPGLLGALARNRLTSGRV